MGRLRLLALTIVFASTTSTAHAKGAWVLVKQTDDVRVAKKTIYYHHHEVRMAASSASQSSRFGGPPFRESGSVSCRGSWSEPPRSLVPGRKIRVVSRVSLEGKDSRGGFHLSSRCSVNVLAKKLNSKGRPLWRISAVKPCSASLQPKTSARQSRTSAWKPPRGSPGQRLALSYGIAGVAGRAYRVYHYVYQLDPETSSGRPPATRAAAAAVAAEWKGKRPTTLSTRGAAPRPKAPSTTAVKSVALHNTNFGRGERSGPHKPSVFILKRPHQITEIVSFHYNGGRGAKPGSIALRAAKRTYGPWRAIARNPDNSKPGFYWVVMPKIVLPAGRYTIIDSDPASWSTNSKVGDRGMGWVYGVPSARR